MKSSESEEPIYNTMPSEEELIKLLHTHHEKNDPRSHFYVRTHVIPEVNWLNAIGKVTLSLCISLLVSLVFFYSSRTFIPAYASMSVPLVFVASMFFIVLIRAKALLVWIIRIYQRFAPLRIRDKCRFEPSCSMYMIQAIEKYGAIKGLSLGVQRLRRCNITGGGYDYP
ncbi:membrane protein insertion efficiency factor YidD [Paenibacillus silvae]|uniref:membrane protein insertion efficiency factor YidD n=2 Tax=Paenibacillus silvae TaxID=1325358 RepID=UPI002A37BA0B|nr:membrane protein insertion efficiency factor YidD [Paenibacillus silvae]